MNEISDGALRSLDAADRELSSGERARAEATLERIVATDPSSVDGGHRVAAGRSPSRRRPAVLADAALALAVTATVLPDLHGEDSAHASWTATPASIDPDDLDTAAQSCRERPHGSSIDADRAELVLAERRGDYVVLLYRTDNPDMSGACLVRNPRGSDDVDHAGTGVGGSTGPALAAPPSGFTQGAITQFAGVSVTDGAVGDDVTGVTIHAGTMEVQASVRNGRYVAWWPGPAFSAEGDRSDGGNGPELLLTYDLTLADGTVLRDVEPTVPS